MKKKKKKGKSFLWIILICILLIAGFHFRKQVTSRIGAYAAKARTAIPAAIDKHSRRAISPKSLAESATRLTFTFLPDANNRYAWSVRYPDGRVFKLGEEFSGDCPPTLKPAKTPATMRFEFVEQRSCDSSARKPISVDSGALKDVNGDGSPELIVATVTGGNVNGHTAALISLTPKGPKIVRRME